MGKYLVTGARGGLGMALCRALVREGHEVWGLDRAPGEEGEGLRCLTADVTRAPELEDAREQVRKQAGGLDGIVCAAGVYDLDSLLEMPEERFMRDFDVNLFGGFRVNQVFLPLLHPGGRIVMVSSELAPLDPLPFTGIYAVTKAAVEKYAQALRMEAQTLGHPVIVVRPGAVDTPMLPVSGTCLNRFCESTRLYKFSAERFRRIVERVETRKVKPEKVAEVIARALRAKKPRLVYTVNRNPLLLIMNALPQRTQLWIIRKILSP